MAANVIGHKQTDHLRTTQLIEIALDFIFLCSRYFTSTLHKQTIKSSFIFRSANSHEIISKQFPVKNIYRH